MAKRRPDRLDQRAQEALVAFSATFGNAASADTNTSSAGRCRDLQRWPGNCCTRLVGVASVLVAFASGLPACVAEQKMPETAVEYENRAKQAYEEALVEFLDHNWEFAAQLMRDVRRNFGYTPYARKAELRLADIAFHQEAYPEAIAAYKGFVHDHPNDPEVPYARFRIIRSQYLTSNNNFFQPPLEERDLSAVRDAYASIRSFLADFPDHEESEEIAFMYESVGGMLARHELYVARFYANEDEFHAAMSRVQYAMRTYQATGLEPEAVVLLGEIYLKMKKRKQAVAMFRHVLARYPDSAFTQPALRFLEQLGEPANGTASSAPVADGATRVKPSPEQGSVSGNAKAPL